MKKVEVPVSNEFIISDQTHKTIIKIMLISAIIIFCFFCSIVGILITEQNNNLVFEKFRDLICDININSTEDIKSFYQNKTTGKFKLELNYTQFYELVIENKEFFRECKNILNKPENVKINKLVDRYRNSSREEYKVEIYVDTYTIRLKYYLEIVPENSEKSLKDISLSLIHI